MDQQGPPCDDDTSASRQPADRGMDSIDAHSLATSLSSLEFVNTLSFLDDLDDMSGAVDALLNGDKPFNEPALLLSDSPTIDHDTTIGAATGTTLANGHGQLLKIHGLPKQTAVQETTKSPPTAGTTSTLKQEIEYLRSQVVELEDTLAQLKTPLNSPATALVMSSAWEKIAKSQNEAKQKAMVENEKLREHLEGQLKIARSLEKLLNKRALMAPTDQYTERKRLRITHAMDTSIILAEIRGRIHLQFDEVDTVMDECGLSVIYNDLEDAQAMTRASADDSICLEAIVAKVLPFPVDQVVDAIWQCLSSNHIEFHNGYFGGASRSEDTCDLNYVQEIKLRRAEAIIRAHGVAARRTESKRSLIMSELAGKTEGTLFAGDPIRCRERGYVLIEENCTADKSISSPSTIIKSCVHLWPEDSSSDGGKATGSRHFGSFIDLLIGSYNRDTRTMLQLVENILLEQALKTNTPGQK